MNHVIATLNHTRRVSGYASKNRDIDAYTVTVPTHCYACGRSHHRGHMVTKNCQSRAYCTDCMRVAWRYHD